MPKVMSFKRFTPGVLLAALALAPSAAQAQLIIDRAGARDLLFGSDLEQLNKESKVRLTFDSKDKSAALGYFSARPLELAGGSLRFGLRPKITALDGWDQFFKFNRVPGVEFSGIANWTPHLPDGPASGAATNFLPFVNLRASFKHQEFTRFDETRPVTSQLSKSSLDGAAVFLSGGALFAGRWGDGDGGVRDQHGVSLSIGYERESNYKDLKKVDVAEVTRIVPLPYGGERLVTSGTQTARVGDLQQFNQFPIDVTYSWDVQLGNWVYAIPFVPDKWRYGTVWSPYAQFEPKDNGKPDHSVGVQLSFKMFTALKAGGGLDQIKSAKLSYPISVFLEWRNPGNERRTVTGGVAAVFTF